MSDRALHSARAARLMDLLGLTEDELCQTLAVDPLTLLSGQIEHRPELGILLTLLDEAGERTSSAVLRRWVRARGPHGRPLDALLARDFAAFEDALAELAERGFVLRGGAGAMITEAPRGPFRRSWRVRFAESDRQDVVFNAHYMAWFDDSMAELWRACFGSYAAAVERGIDIVLAEAQLHFRAPARFEDELALEVAVTHLGTTSVVTEHACRRDGELLVQGTLRHVTVDPATLRKAPMPDWFRTALARWGVA